MAIEWFIKNNDWMMFNHEHGWGNGYVIIPKGHLLHGIHYDDLEAHIAVHGGLTFSELLNIDVCLCFGIDPVHDGDWLIGFDTAHCGDNGTTWSRSRVMTETIDLYNQIKDFKL